MIQRVQTLYLAVAMGALTWLLLSGLPATLPTTWQAVIAYALGVSILGLMGAALFRYKDRSMQRLLATIALGEMVLFAAFLYGSLYFAGTLSLQSFDGNRTAHVLRLLMPVVAYISLRLALMGIKRDIDLIKSADRLR